MSCLTNGAIFTWSLNVSNNSTITVTGVTVAVTLPLGISLANTVPTKGTYNTGTDVWTIGSINAGASHTLSIEVEVTDESLQPYTINAIVAGNEFEPYVLNNIANNIKGGACGEGCAGGFNCNDNLVSCTCGQISLLSGTCSPNSTIDYRIVENSEVNAVVDLDPLTGNYHITIEDRDVETWSFDYEVYCCCGEVCTGPLTSCTISGNTDCCPETITTLVTVDGGDSYTYTNENGDETVINIATPYIDTCECDLGAEITYSGISTLVYNSAADTLTFTPTNNYSATYDIDWGDGTIVYGLTSGLPTSHEYTNEAAFRVISIIDPGGAVATRIYLEQLANGSFELMDSTEVVPTLIGNSLEYSFIPSQIVSNNCPVNDISNIVFTTQSMPDDFINLSTTIEIDSLEVFAAYLYETQAPDIFTAVNAWRYGAATKSYEAWTEYLGIPVAYYKGEIVIACGEVG